MATAFIGLSVIVRLKHPHGLLLRGLVTDVRDQRLFLDYVYDLSNQWNVGQASFLGQDIEDIEVAPPAAAPPPPPTAQAAPALRQNKAPPPASITDPAIVSFARTPAGGGPPAQTAPSEQNAAKQLPSPNVSANLATPFVPLALANSDNHTDNSVMSMETPYRNPGVSSGRDIVNARGNKQQKKKTRMQAASTDMSRQQSNGWRQTPILVDSASPQKKEPTKQSRKQLQKLHFEEQYGEASDFQDLPDFDFAGNNAKFDKQAAFDQIRNEDTTADEDRLVSHNRLPRPGTFGGSKLHPTEPVLDRPSATTANDMTLSDSDDDQVVALDASMSSQKLRPAARTSSKRRDNALTREALTRVPRSNSQGRLASSLSKANSSIAGDRSSPSLSASRSRRPCLRYSSTNQVCLTIPPTIIQAAELQATCRSHAEEAGGSGDAYSLTPDILAENAARSIAEVALSAINLGGRRSAKDNLNPDPVVVILAGECEAGARAIAAGRHMSERGVRVVVAFPDVDEQVVLRQAHVQRQLDRFRGKQMEWEELQAHLKTLDAPPELIVDGLFGVDKKFSALRQDDRTVALQMMAWANKSKASVLAVDIPSGIDPESGAVQVFEGEPAEMRAKMVVACGAPCSGLLKAVQSKHAEGYGDTWKMFVCDIGVTAALQQAVKKKYRDSLAFGPAWTVPVHFDKGTSSDN